MNKVGILAYGSLIDDPGKEITPLIASRIKNIRTPFNIEFARSSKTRDGAPTLTIVEVGGAPVKATILVLEDTVSISQAMDMVWRRETRNENTGLPYKPDKVISKNKVLVETLKEFHGIDDKSVVETLKNIMVLPLFFTLKLEKILITPRLKNLPNLLLRA